MKKKLVLGIIGGKGQMGGLFAKLFRPYVKEILISDLDGPISKEKLIQNSDVVLIGVPIRVTEEVIKEIIPHVTQNQLLIDMTSVKVKPCEAMLKSKASVIGLHPLFGPSVQSFKNQSVIICPVREGEWKQWLKQILKEGEAKIVEMTPEKHDEYMAIMQSLVHFIAMVFAKTLEKRSIDPKEALSCSTPVFKMLFYITGRILHQSNVLYQDIQMENPFFPEILKTFEENYHELREIDLKKDRKSFDELFESLGDYFGDLKQEGFEKTVAFFRGNKPC